MTVVGQHRGARDRRRARPRHARADRPRRHRGRARRDRLRRWSPRIARMAGASIPLTPDGPPDDRHRPGAAVRRRQDADRVPDRPRHGHEHVRAPGGHGLEIGSYAHRPIMLDADEIPSIEESALTPDRAAVHPGGLRPADGAGARADARDRRRRDGRREVRDQRPAVGDARRPAAARRDARGRRAVVGGRDLDQGGPRRRQDGRRADGPRRVGDRRLRVQHRARLPAPEDQGPRPARASARASTRCTGSSTPPSSGSPTAASRLSPFYEREQELGAVVLSRPPAGSARSGTSQTRRCSRSTATGSPGARPSGSRAGGRRSSTPSTWRCATAPAMIDLTAFAIFDVTGPGALDAVQRVAMRQMDVAGRARRLHAGADAERRLQGRPDDHAARRRRVPRRHRRRLRDVGPASGSPTTCPPTARAQIHDQTNAWSTLGLWGPRARDILAGVTCDDVSHEGFPFARCRTIEVGPLQVLASRISYVGDLGWELYVPIEQGARLWDIVAEAGRAARRRPGRDRRVRHHRPAREVLPRLRRRARGRLRRRRGRDGVGQGQGRRTSSARRRTCASARRSRRRSCAR